MNGWLCAIPQTPCGARLRLPGSSLLRDLRNIAQALCACLFSPDSIHLANIYANHSDLNLKNKNGNHLIIVFLVGVTMSLFASHVIFPR